jgi:hypothetical protein
MPRCPLCGSSSITILVSLQPQAFCDSCGARWIQDGHQQRAIHRVPEPGFMASSRAPQPDRLRLERSSW